MKWYQDSRPSHYYWADLHIYYMRSVVPEAGGCFNIKMPSYQYSYPHVKDKKVLCSLIFKMGIPISEKDSLYIEMGPMQVWRAGTSNYIPQYTCPCPWYLLLAQHSWYIVWCWYNMVHYYIKVRFITCRRHQLSPHQRQAEGCLLLVFFGIITMLLQDHIVFIQ